MQMPIANAPTAERPAEQRLDVIDALRGFALAGVLLSNLRDFSLYTLLDENAQPGGERWLRMLLAALLDAKAMTVFALLFGVGFALQLERAEHGGAAERLRARRRYAWRLCLLLGFGLLHAAFWYGDILRYYAVLGLLLLPLARCRPATLALLGAFVAVIATAALQPFMRPWAAQFAPAAQAAAAARAAFESPHWAGMLAGNRDYDLWLHATAWSLPFFTLGRLLLGMAIGRAGWLQRPQQHLRAWRRLLAWSLPTGLVLAAYLLLRDFGGLGPELFGLRGDAARALSRLLRNLAYLSLGLGYVAGFVLLFQHPRARRWLGWLAPVGRMALSNYLAQTALGLALFYGVGAGLGPRYGLAGVLAAFAAVFAAQAVFSHCWLRRFRYGPLEWFWRCLTYRRALPLRRAPAAAAAPEPARG
ncbi:uncharacterized protein SAMN04487939_101509 [Lysobacter sp. yr284]|uniref:DUF418 domain-containing protein n=1 Tax=Lysobacter sp. yr284 TaxID=1761791 RepID=UPI00089695B4|nr:DUF418 domain-containing protein [Lysobacter sp. yr284]SDY25961.1 uncharacterized protein SAMN04487939_101509 [Lysobacter sp. yr284]